MRGIKIGVDIGGTFTDVVLEDGSGLLSLKLLTTPENPEAAVLAGVSEILERSGYDFSDIEIFVHGTTLATNALIERKGAPTALLTTEGFRDVLEMRSEGRFEQYDFNIVNPAPLVPREWRIPVRERIGAAGEVVIGLDDSELDAVAAKLAEMPIESLAIGFLHSYANPAHERRAAAYLAARLPGLSISLSCEVSPEMREYERFSTTAANAYVRPLIETYLSRLGAALAARGLRRSVLMVLSSGSLTTIDTAMRFPVRLVESGPAGGAIFAADLARRNGLSQVISFDMGGTTAKICFIDAGSPQTSRLFEVARIYRFKKGSGLPLRIPVVEMVEIGAGGGSIAGQDKLLRMTVGPESAGADPGPACYGRGGRRATVTDANLALGRLDGKRFAGGSITLDEDAAGAALAELGRRFDTDAAACAAGLIQIVEENMANAARVHGIESGKEIAGRTLIAFGGAAPLHVGSIAQKLGITRFIVPHGAGVGSAIGFLRAPIAFEIVRSRYQRVDSLDQPAIAAMLAEMHREAAEVVRQVDEAAALENRAIAYMRYAGQGHEIAVEFDGTTAGAGLAATLRKGFEAAYATVYSRAIEDGEIEILSWSVTAALRRPAETTAQQRGAEAGPPPSVRLVIDPADGSARRFAVVERTTLAPGDGVDGPALIIENETTTVLPAGFHAIVDSTLALICERFTEG